MRTTLDIDDNLLAALLALHSGLSKTAAIEAAVREHLASHAAGSLRQLAGSIDIQDVSGESRDRDRST